MGSNSNLFKITFMVSLAVHAVFFLPIPTFKKPKQIETTQLNLSYFIQKIPEKKLVAKFKYKKISLKDEAESLNEKLAAEPLQNSVDKDHQIERPIPKAVNKQSNVSNDIVKMRQEIKLRAASEVSKEKDLFKNKSYISYYKLINEQLRQSVICPQHFSEGEIGLSFVLDSDGILKNVRVIETASLVNETLKETAMQIVKRASPFPPFPKNLQQKQLTFNIVFCFKESS